MSDITIPDAARVAAVSAVNRRMDVHGETRLGYLVYEAIAAAAPLIAAKALREAAEAVHPFHPVGGHTPVTRGGLYDWLRDRADRIERGE